LRVARIVARTVQKPALVIVRSNRVLRGLFDLNARVFHRHPRGLRQEAGRVGGVPGVWIVTDGQTETGILLYLHGGGFVLGSVAGYAHMIGPMAAQAGLRAWAPSYRLAPEHPFPAAADDALASYRGLLELGHDPARIVLAGDSAGAGLALSILADIAASDLPMPGAVVAISAIADMTLEAASLRANVRRDPLIAPGWGQRSLEAYRAGADPRTPRLSPIFARFPRTCPVLLQVGAEEMLLDDSRTMADVLRRDGAPVSLRIWPGVIHSWPILCGLVPEADAAIAEAAAFVRRALGPADA